MSETKYKCPKCNEISRVENWNESTISNYGNGIELIQEDRGGCSYVCPKCEYIVKGSEITEN